MSAQHHWVQVLGREIRSSHRVISEKTVMHGRRKVTRMVTETTEEPYVLLSCGHQERAVNFDCRGKDRKRVDCFECRREAKEAGSAT